MLSLQVGTKLIQPNPVILGAAVISILQARRLPAQLPKHIGCDILCHPRRFQRIAATDLLRASESTLLNASAKCRMLCITSSCGASGPRIKLGLWMATGNTEETCAFSRYFSDAHFDTTYPFEFFGGWNTGSGSSYSSLVPSWATPAVEMKWKCGSGSPFACSKASRTRALVERTFAARMVR